LDKLPSDAPAPVVGENLQQRDVRRQHTVRDHRDEPHDVAGVVIDGQQYVVTAGQDPQVGLGRGRIRPALEETM
jgi:hypothetical protein